MKYLRNWSKNDYKETPKVGDYIVVKLKNDPTEIARVLEKHIGRIQYRYCDNNGMCSDSCEVKFGSTNWWIDIDDIIDCSKNKEDLEYYIQANKYNVG